MSIFVKTWTWIRVAVAIFSTAIVVSVFLMALAEAIAKFPAFVSTAVVSVFISLIILMRGSVVVSISNLLAKPIWIPTLWASVPVTRAFTNKMVHYSACIAYNRTPAWVILIITLIVLLLTTPIWPIGWSIRLRGIRINHKFLLYFVLLWGLGSDRRHSVHELFELGLNGQNYWNFHAQVRILSTAPHVVVEPLATCVPPVLFY